MQRTIPQILMLNHAAWREMENAKRRAEFKHKAKEELDEKDPYIPEYGMRMSELQANPELYDRYMNTALSF